MTDSTTIISTGAQRLFDDVIQTFNGKEYGCLMRLIDTFRGEITAEHAQEMIQKVIKVCRWT
jgi:hypothetical protein